MPLWRIPQFTILYSLILSHFLSSFRLLSYSCGVTARDTGTQTEADGELGRDVSAPTQPEAPSLSDPPAESSHHWLLFGPGSQHRKSPVWLFATPWTIACQTPVSIWDSPGKNTGVGSPGKNTGVGCCSLLQGIFLTWGSNSGLLHCRQILNGLSHQETVIATKSNSFIFTPKCKTCLPFVFAFQKCVTLRFLPVSPAFTLWNWAFPRHRPIPSFSVTGFECIFLDTLRRRHDLPVTS